ncbi:PAS domain-containing protein [Desulfovibrio sp. Huiquan2017]|uniref:PAS domain-containing protein n=1 Tax=Desulfovibrio sp. Huiquan2017 TaxID=2816861 RepID=UPI001A92DA07|nr:PAS domain-containing protein [Desulfovibrio sp. Huiquan2017]
MPDSTAKPNNPPEEKILANYLEELPGIVWRINVVNNEITFLNKYAASPEGERIRAVLQNPQIPQEVIVPKDREQFRYCHQLIRSRRRTACSFRVRSETGPVKWFKLMGMPDPVHPQCSIGILLDISDHAETILKAMGSPRLSAKIDMMADPVLLVRFVDRTVHLANQAARQFLGYDDQTLAQMTLQDLLRHNPDTDLYQIYESLIFSDHWNGDLLITDAHGKSHLCTARIQAISRQEDNLLWMTLSHHNNCTACKGLPVRGNEAVSAKFSNASLRRCASVRTLLKAMLRALPKGAPTSALLLSRIFINENFVAVTGVGAPFEKDPEDFAHPYEGSIAESIVRFKQPNHVVAETSKSIKAIDWALFIPRGIRSYYAQPFYEDDILTYVLIFCSTEPDSYDPDAEAPLLPLHGEFLVNLDRCLKKKR